MYHSIEYLFKSSQINWLELFLYIMYTMQIKVCSNCENGQSMSVFVVWKGRLPQSYLPHEGERGKGLANYHTPVMNSCTEQNRFVNMYCAGMWHLLAVTWSCHEHLPGKWWTLLFNTKPTIISAFARSLKVINCQFWSTRNQQNMFGSLK